MMRSETTAHVVPPVAIRARRLGHLRRYHDIAAVLVKYGFVDVVDALHLAPYRAGGRPPRRSGAAMENQAPLLKNSGPSLSLRHDRPHS